MRKTYLFLLILGMQSACVLSLHAKKTASVILLPDSLYLSPNKDGLRDGIRFEVKPDGLKDIASWELQIKDSAQIVRRTISGTRRLPEQLAWDGLDEFGARAPEGNYEAMLRVWDSKNQYVEAQVGKLVLDLTPPTLSLTASAKKSQVSDGKFMPLTLYFSAVDLSGLNEWKIQIFDDKMQVFFTEPGTGALPSSWVYEGKDLPESARKMTAILNVIDQAGNKSNSAPLEIEIERPGSKKSAQRAEPAATPPAASASASAPETAAPIAEGVPDRTPARTAANASVGPLMQMTSIVSLADLFGDDADAQTPLLPQAAILLSPLAQALLDSPGSRATILGHIESSASGDGGRSASSAFAWKVFSYFVKEKGVDKNSLSVKGLGGSVPIADNRTALGRVRNRRIEIQLFLPRNKP